MSEEEKKDEAQAEAKPEESKVGPAPAKAPAAEPASAKATADADKSVEVEVPEKFKKLVDEIEKMSVLDLSELVKVLEDKFGVSAAAPVAVAAAGGAGGGEAAGEEKDSFDVELTAAGDNKIGAIKVVREVTGKGLKDAKDMVEGAPIIVKEGAKKEEAEEIKKKIEAAGAQATLK